MAIRIYSSVSSLWKLCSKHILFHICPWRSKDNCFSLSLDSLLSLFLPCKYNHGVLVFTGYGYYLRGEAVGGANMARASWSCRQHYGSGPAPSPCWQPLTPSVSASLQKHDEMGLSEATLTLPNPWSASDLTEHPWRLQTQPVGKHTRRKQCEAVKDRHGWHALERKEKVRQCFEVKFDMENPCSHLLVLNPWKRPGIPVSITIATHPLSSLIRSRFLTHENPREWRPVIELCFQHYWVTDVSTHSRNYYIYLFWCIFIRSSFKYTSTLKAIHSLVSFALFVCKYAVFQLHVDQIHLEKKMVWDSPFVMFLWKILEINHFGIKFL